MLWLPRRIANLVLIIGDASSLPVTLITFYPKEVHADHQSELNSFFSPESCQLFLVSQEADLRREQIADSQCKEVRPTLLLSIQN
jgi:hypothetical protein